jgi:hypothetical protein
VVLGNFTSQERSSLTRAWSYQQEYPEKLSEFLSDILIAKIAKQYF